MNVLCACEESQAVTIEMRNLGHNAYSCDTQPCSGGHPEWHIQGDVTYLLNGRCCFVTMDGSTHIVRGRWDMIIGFPPCTYLSAAGAVRLFDKNGDIKDYERYQKGLLAARFFLRILRADCEKVIVENPVPLRIFGLPHYSQTTEPYYHGDPWKKKTCLWLKGVAPLVPTDIVTPNGLWVGSTSANRDPDIYTRYVLHSNRDPKRRAKTFPGIARAMAEQWAGANEIGPALEREPGEPNL